MIELGKTFVVMGDWDTKPEPEGKVVIRMPVAPRGTYGCWNKTTRMCIEELERRITSGMTVLDYGTGSGILALVAYHLGATVYATEVDAKIAEFAQRVWALNNVPVELLESFSLIDPSQEAYFSKDLQPKEVITSDLPEVDLCVANVGDQLWEFNHLIHSKVLINVTNKGELVVNSYA